jgi:hypothetical protein
LKIFLIKTEQIYVINSINFIFLIFIDLFEYYVVFIKII